METTTEIKAKVMSPYIGRRVYWSKINQPVLTLYESEEDSVSLRVVIASKKKLILKPLSEITGEHAIEVAKILGWKEELTGRSIINYLINPVGFITIRPENLIEVVEYRFAANGRRKPN